MKKDRRVWWRIVTGCFLLLAVAANVVLYVVLKWGKNSGLVRRGPYRTIVFRYTGAEPPEQVRKYVNSRLKSFGPIETEALDRAVGVTMPFDPQAGAKGRLPDPDQLAGMLNRGGSLAFRIAPTAPGTGGKDALSEADYTTYLDQLAKDAGGADEASPFVWLPIREGAERLNSQLVIERLAGRRYLLVANRPEQAMLHGQGCLPWSLRASPGSDTLGRPAARFELDQRGARLMSALTTANKDGYLAIAVDDEVYSAPVIRATIGASGIIEGNFTRREVRDMVRMLNQTAMLGSDVRFSVKAMWTCTYGYGPKSGTKRAALWAVGFAAAVLLAVWLVAMAGGRLHLACLGALLVPLSAIAFWQIVQWNNPAARGLGTISPVTNGIIAALAAGIWILAASLGRRHKPPVLPAVKQPVRAGQ